MTGLKKTPLFPLYAGYPGVRCIDFGGWLLPVQFSGIQKEHEAVRQRAGLFDVSHMGEFLVTGRQAQAFVQRITTNDAARLSDGQAQYSLMCYGDGGVVDDLLVYRLKKDRYLLVVNASNIDKDWAWLQDQLIDGVTLENQSDTTALLALQGPLAADILARSSEARAVQLPPFHFLHEASIGGTTALISRTGYTGEDGFELYLPAEAAVTVWNALLEAGEPLGLVPAGLGARDTLRFEARLPLYGQELSPFISPLEAGLSPFVKLAKGEFIGREALLEQQAKGIPRKLIGIEMLERGIPRSHYPIYADGQLIGEVTTGTQSPTLKRALGLALVQTAFSKHGTECTVDIRGNRLRAVVVQTPFYRKNASTP
ncbi:glycine cleavage system aminomethyltransferase GcvT [Paenibacillus rigui]|uniref:Aminomethyltransferase n=1 Tax=Paenibacillus rigui TaxID=554312 RepID=A0A229UVX1_9BACL|nr:glycine cleavage system aminomethyltransferase GcvT [Paenibacillus rigui]OXM87453.1 glycine cleavage system protein T [Paenibacillus rigui]